MKIAIYGGSFDPPHVGHQMVVQKALESLDIDRLFIIPAWINPFKSSFYASPSRRLEWIKKVWEDEKKVSICEFELDNKRPTTTYESVMHLYENEKIEKCYCIIGADNLKGLKKWANYDKLCKKVEFVVASREGAKISSDLKKLQINANISSTQLRKRMDVDFIPKIIAKDVQKYYKRIKQVEKTLEKIVDFIDSKKGENIQVFDMRDKDYFTDYVIIASTLGERHSNALNDDLKPLIKELGEECVHVDATGEWVVMDLGHILIHLMSAEYRAKYNLESFLSDFEKQREKVHN